MKTQSPQKRYKATMKRRGIPVARHQSVLFRDLPISPGGSADAALALVPLMAMSMMRRRKV